MNTKSERIPENNLKSFRWRKEWVRPYESFYSVVRNFCKVNVVTPKKMFQIFGISTADPFTIKNVKRRTNYDIFFNSVFPEGFIDYSQIIQSGIHRLQCCPICWADGYHSYLHNIGGAEECPFHHISLEETDITYDIIDGIRLGKENKSKRNTDALECILPCERQLTNDYNINLPQISTCIPFNTKKPESLKYAVKPFLSKNNWPIFFTIKSFTGSKAEYEEYLINDIENKNIRFRGNEKIEIKNNIHINKITKEILTTPSLCYNVSPDIWNDYVELCLLKEYQNYYDTFIKNFRNAYYPSDIINNPTISQITTCLIKYICGFHDYQEAINSNWVFHPGCAVYRYRRSYPDLDILQLTDFCDSNKRIIWDMRLIAVKVIEDLLRNLHQKLVKTVTEKGFIDPINDWKLLRVPEYYAVKYEGDSDWTILRYDAV